MEPETTVEQQPAESMMETNPNDQMYTEAGMDVDIIDKEQAEIDLNYYIGMFAAAHRERAREKHLEIQSIVNSLG